MDAAKPADGHAADAHDKEKKEQAEPNPIWVLMKKNTILFIIMAGLIALAIYAMSVSPQPANGTVQGASAAVQKQADKLAAGLGAADSEQPAGATDPDQGPAPAKVVRETCDAGWSWDGTACTREARPSAEQHAASIVRMKCKRGETRTVEREIMVGTRKVHRTVTQTCETLS